MNGAAAISVLPSATFWTEFVSVWPDATWISATPSLAAASESEIIEMPGVVLGDAVSADRTVWASAPTVANKDAATAANSFFDIHFPP